MYVQTHTRKVGVSFPAHHVLFQQHYTRVCKMLPNRCSWTRGLPHMDVNAHLPSRHSVLLLVVILEPRLHVPLHNFLPVVSIHWTGAVSCHNACVLCFNALKITLVACIIQLFFLCSSLQNPQYSESCLWVDLLPLIIHHSIRLYDSKDWWSDGP